MVDFYSINADLIEFERNITPLLYRLKNSPVESRLELLKKLSEDYDVPLAISPMATIVAFTQSVKLCELSALETSLIHSFLFGSKPSSGDGKFERLISFCSSAHVRMFKCVSVGKNSLELLCGKPSDDFHEFVKNSVQEVTVASYGKAEIYNLNHMKNIARNQVRFTLAVDGNGDPFMMMYFAFEFLTDEYHYVGGLGRRVDFDAADVYDVHELILTMHDNWEYNLNFSKEFVEANFSNLI